MFSFSYNLSSRLHSDIEKIENLRKTLLIKPVPRAIELQLQFENLAKKIYFLNHQTNDFSHAHILKILTLSDKKNPIREEKEILEFKKAFDYIRENWYVTGKKVTPETILFLFKTAGRRNFGVSEKELQHFLEYLQTKEEHPLIQAGTAIIFMENTQSFHIGNGHIGSLTAELFLQKHGYDCRGMLCIEEYFSKDLALFSYQAETALRSSNITLFLEYFTQGVIMQLEAALKTLSQASIPSSLPKSFWHLSERQKRILSYLSTPNTTISNKSVQKMTKVSQITASRDLTKLTNLGLIFTHGKGRSVYYTRV